MSELLASLIDGFAIPICGILVVFIFAYVVFSWLLVANIVNLRNPTMRMVYDVLNAVIHPLLAPFKRFVPPLGGLDFSPIAALLLLQWLAGYLLPSISASLKGL